jgi:opacity protein-like surface antigen
MMKNVLLTTAIATCLASTAFAGAVETTISAQPDVVDSAPQITDWGGAYAGIMGAMTSGEHYDYPSDLPTTIETYTLEGTMYGAFAGYNIQRDSFVYGIEAAYSLGSIKSEPLGLWPLEYNSFIDLKARVGFATGNALIYGFAGGSMAEYQYFTGGFGSEIGYPISPVGISYGAGVDLQLTDQIFIGAEYIVRQLSDPLEDYETYTMDNDIQAIQVRAGYRF